MGRSLWPLDSIIMRIMFIVLYFATFVLAQDLAFMSPDLSPVVSGGDRPHYTVGQYVTVSWTTPFEETNLLVYQLKEKAYAYEVLALNYGKNVTFYVWSAGAVDGQPLNAAHPFHFVLENGKSYACRGCVTQSPQFDVRRARGQVAGSSSSARAPTSTSASTSTTGAGATPTSQTQTHQTHEPTSTPSAPSAAGQQEQASPAQSASKSHHDLGIGLGVGLGLGIPLLLAIAGLCFFLARRRRKQSRRVSYHPTGSGNWTTDEMQQHEAGALGRWESQKSQRSERNQSRASGLSQMSHNSWIDPFEFEKPELRDQDALSQLRQSIHSSGSDSRVKDAGIETPPKTRTSRETPSPISRKPVPVNDANMKYAWMGGTAGPAKASNGWGAGTAAARRSDVSWANTDISSLEGMPEQLQPVHRFGSPTGHSGYTPPSRGDGRDWPLP